MAKLSSLSLFARLYLTIAIAMVFSGSLSVYFIEKMHVQGAIDEYVMFTDNIYADLINEKKFVPTTPLEELTEEVHKVDGYLISWKIVFEEGPPCDVCEWVANSGDVEVYRNDLNQWFAVYKLANIEAWFVIFETNIFNFAELEKAKEEGLLSNISFHEFEDLSQLLIIFVTIAIAIYFPVRVIKNQIESLIKVQHQFGAGDMKARANNEYSKPIDELASSFNWMANSISDTVTENQLFAQAIPHEARTPLSRIQLAVGLLSRNNDDPQQLELLENINTYIGDINTLINQIVSFSKLNSVSHEAELLLYHNINLSTFIESRVKATECDLKLDCVLELDSSLTLNTNPVFLRLMLDNLLNNAAIYGKNQITIALYSANEKIILTVSDDGNGIPKEHLDKIFIPFYRVDASRSRNTGGLGLGLAICNVASKRMGGQLAVENNKTAGAKFTFQFPKD